LPGKEIPKLGLFDQFDKVVHFSFFFLFFLFWYAWKPSYLGWILLAIVYGFAIEGYQRYCVSGRNFDVWDGVADTLGALAAAGLIFFFSKRLPDEKASSRGR
jgi:VanZ family protein